MILFRGQVVFRCLLFDNSIFVNSFVTEREKKMVPEISGRVTTNYNKILPWEVFLNNLKTTWLVCENVEYYK